MNTPRGRNARPVLRHSVPIRRRQLLQSGVAAGVWAAFPSVVSAQAGRKAVFLILDGISPGLSAPALQAAIAPLRRDLVPVAIVLPPAPQPMRTATADVIRHALTNSPLATELVLAIDDLLDHQPYFQLRAAYQARDAARRILDPALIHPIVTIRAKTVPGSRPSAGLRASGVRNLLLATGEDGATESLCPEPGISALQGGHTHRIGVDPVQQGIEAISREFEASRQLALTLNLSEVGETPVSTIEREVQVFADLIGMMETEGKAYSLLPRDHGLWCSDDPARMIGLRILPPRMDSPGETAKLDAFLKSLGDAGFADFKTVHAGELDGCPTYTSVPARAPRACVAVTRAFASRLGTQAQPLADLGVEVIVTPEGTSAPGFDAQGILRAPETVMIGARTDPRKALSTAGNFRDQLVTIAPEAYATRAGQQALVAALRPLNDGPASRVTDLGSYLSKVDRPDPVFERYRATRRHRLNPFEPAMPPDQTALLEDARTAWRYVSEQTDATTGLCPSTVRHHPIYPARHDSLTMWDMASLMNATVCAHQLGLISSVELLLRIDKITTALPFVEIDGATLPASEVDTRTGKPVTRDFNACDTGRLLSALHILDAYAPTRGMGSELVAGWDLDRVIAGGMVRSITGLRKEPLNLSHCTHYTSRAFGLWGHAVDTPYSIPSSMSQADGRMALLYRCVEIGPIGAEPLLLEGVEMGLSEPSAYLADVLESAQMMHHENGGPLVAVSESPIDREPWFTFQGLALNARTDIWDVQAPGAPVRWQTAEFRDEAMLLSTKAAYLWAAARPSAYADKLVDLVRSKTRLSKGGFAAGIYQRTGRAISGYTDINTNGVILQAIARILRG